MPRGLEVAAAAVLPFEPAQFEPIYAETEPNEPQPGALFLVGSLEEQTVYENSTRPERCERAQRYTFDRRMATLLLELNEKKILPKLMGRPQLEELYGFGFKQQKSPHITILSYCNGRRIIRALGGDRKRLGAIEAEASRVDWSWRPTGEFFSYQGRRRGSLKIMALVECPAATDFYDRLEGELPDLQLERDPLHITLMRKRGELSDYTNATIGGIAIGRPVHSLRQLYA